MDLHSYAKRKAPKKWTIEQKRRLVNARIKHDDVFFTTAGTSWQKILRLAELEEYAVPFVRKQWANMIAKYQQYKQRMIQLAHPSFPELDNEIIARLTEEWEFFQPIHAFMARKTARLHSYALQSRQNEAEDAAAADSQQQQEQQTPLNLANKAPLSTVANTYHSSTENLHHFSSDTNEEYVLVDDAAAAAPLLQLTRNTDHDFYSKRLEQNIYFADASDETQDSVVAAAAAIVKQEPSEYNSWQQPEDVQIKTEPADEYENRAGVPFKTIRFGRVGSKLKRYSQAARPTQFAQAVDLNTSSNTLSASMAALTAADAQPAAATTHSNAVPGASTTTPSALNLTISSPRTVKRLTEKEKYYRHKKRYNHRLELRLDAIIKVVGQVVKAKFADVDLSALEQVTTATSAALEQSDDSSSDDME